MTDRDRVIYDIERCICHVPDACRDCSKCVTPRAHCMEDLLSDTLALIREQEPVKPTKQHIEKSKVDIWYCGECGNWIGQTFTYCPWCGRAVKWDA